VVLVGLKAREERTAEGLAHLVLEPIRFRRLRSLPNTLSERCLHTCACRRHDHMGGYPATQEVANEAIVVVGGVLAVSDASAPRDYLPDAQLDKVQLSGDIAPTMARMTRYVHTAESAIAAVRWSRPSRPPCAIGSARVG